MGQTGEHAPQSPDFKVDPNSIGGRAIAWFRRYRANKIAERLAERQARPPLGIAMPGKPWDKLTPEEREAQWTRFDRAGETVLGMTGQLATRALEYPGIATLRNAISENLRGRYGVQRADSLARQIVSDRVYHPMERRIMGVRGETLPSVMQNLESGIWPGMKVAVLPEYTVSRAGSGYFTGGKGNPDYPGVRILMRREAVLPDPKTRTIADPVDVGSETTGSLFDPRTVRTRRRQVANRVHRAEVLDRDEDVPLPFDPIDTSLRNAIDYTQHMDYFYAPAASTFRYARAAQWPYILEEQDSMRFGPKTVNALRHQTRKRLEDRYREMLWEGADVVREDTRGGALVWDPKLRMVYPRGYPVDDFDRYQHNFFSLPYADSPGGKYPNVLRDMILKGSHTRNNYFYADSWGSSAFPIVHPETSIRNMLQDTYGETQILREIRDTEAAKAFLFDSRLKSMDPKTLDRAQGILRERGIPYDVYNNAAEEAVLSTEMGAPFRQDAKGGEGEDRFSMSRNFLARDEVPDTIFGIQIVADEDSYTPEDLEFFRKHPEAGGYYDMGEETPEDGSAEGAPTQADMPKRGKYPGKLNNPGNVEKRAKRRRGEVDSPHVRWSKFATPQDGLREMADAIRQIADVKLAEKDRPFTIRNFAEIYAPRFNEKGEPENDTDKYIRDISSTSGIGADAVLDRWNTDDMAKLLKTVVRFESGVPHSEWFTDDEYRTAARELEEGATD